MSDDPAVTVPNAWNKIAADLQSRGHFHAAAAAVRRAVLLAPHRADLLSNYGNMLRRIGRIREAYAALDQAFEIDGNDPNICFNDAVLQATEYGDFDTALDEYAWCLERKPGDGNMLFARACALLADGRWKEGFTAYDDRLTGRKFPWHFWDGQPLKKEHTLLIHGEQGLGDIIMFHRYALELARRQPDASVIYMVPTVLSRLLGAARVGVEAPDPDFHIPLMSLPRALGIETVSGAPYLKPVQKMRLNSSPGTKYRIGLVWKAKSGLKNMGVDEHWHGERKSMPLEILLELVRIKGADLYGLQTHCDDIDRIGAKHLIKDLAPAIHDFSDLASFVDQMDVLVTADTAPAHLGGALGVPTIVCCHNYAAWQWGNGTTSPWYDSVKIVRGAFDADRIATAVEECLM